MIHIRTERAVPPTPLRAVSNGLPGSSSTANDMRPEGKEYETLRSAAAKPPFHVPQQEPFVAAKQAAARARRRSRLGAFFTLLPLALTAVGQRYALGGQVTSTDYAYVEAHRVGISTDVSGIVQEVEVSDNQRVTAGQVLFRLDPRQFQTG